MNLIKSELLSSISNIDHHFGTAAEPLTPLYQKEWNSSAPTWKQVHGIMIRTITQGNQELGEVDGMTTSALRMPVGVRTADCVPILLAKKDGSQIAALHAGWRGTIKKIIQKFSDSVGDLKGWYACLGPSISMVHYQVNQNLIDQFKEAFSDLPSKEWMNDQCCLDLAQINMLELKRCGIKEVEKLTLCTYSSLNQETGLPTYFSHRRNNKDPGRQISMLIRKD